MESVLYYDSHYQPSKKILLCLYFLWVLISPLLLSWPSTKNTYWSTILKFISWDGPGRYSLVALRTARVSMQYRDNLDLHHHSCFVFGRATKLCFWMANNTLLSPYAYATLTRVINFKFINRMYVSVVCNLTMNTLYVQAGMSPSTPKEVYHGAGFKLEIIKNWRSFHGFICVITHNTCQIYLNINFPPIKLVFYSAFY